ncbi:hypothetical protein ERJ75_000448800 [Trypanosoma vivax]|nr:hypothetical protein ERJ75_000448800 [Trypanosoma vivax]
MFRLAQLPFLLWLCATAALGTDKTNCTVSLQNKDCEKEFLWVLYAAIDTPFRRAEQLALNVSHELTKSQQKKREIDEAIKFLSGKPQDSQDDLSIQSQLGNESVALKKIIELYQNVSDYIKKTVNKMKKITQDEDDEISTLNVVSGSIWALKKSYGGWFEDLERTFKLIEESSENNKYKTFANAVVERAVADEKNLTNVQAVLFKLLDNVTERYKYKVDGYVEWSLENLKLRAQTVIRNFTFFVEQIQSKIEAEIKSGEGKTAREGVEAAERKIVDHILKMVTEAKSKRCDKCKQWR